MIRSTPQIARLARHAAKSAPQKQQQKRTFISSFVAVPNKVKEHQAKQMAGGICQGAENPTYLKLGSKDKAVNGFGMFVVGTGLMQIIYGFYHLANGSNKLE